MGENTLYKRFLPLVILTVGILLQGCKDDVFNPEKVKAAYQDRFPVKKIDPATTAGLPLMPKSIVFTK